MARALRTTRELEFQLVDDPYITVRLPVGTVCMQRFYNVIACTGITLRYTDCTGADWICLDAHIDEYEAI